MGDPVIERARQTLQTLSDDPMARETARLRFNAQVVNRLEGVALFAEGEAHALRGAILGRCAALSVPIDPTREALLAQGDVTSPQHLFDVRVREGPV